MSTFSSIIKPLKDTFYHSGCASRIPDSTIQDRKFKIPRFQIFQIPRFQLFQIFQIPVIPDIPDIPDSKIQDPRPKIQIPKSKI
ncbi:MAG: hypothetical protein IPN69_22110 [Acidobacteria bacterium]|nr:hypothetical protein [Acidobacteriota bacterium]